MLQGEVRYPGGPIPPLGGDPAAGRLAEVATGVIGAIRPNRGRGAGACPAAAGRRSPRSTGMPARPTRRDERHHRRFDVGDNGTAAPEGLQAA